METISQPYNLDIQLYPHQLHSIYMMEELERNKCLEKDNVKIYTKIGINSDITGYGKTISMIGLILRDKMEWDLNSIYTEERLELYTHKFQKNITYQYQKVNTTLILVNKPLVSHWIKEFSHTNLRVCSITKPLEVYNTCILEYDVIIVIPNLYNALIDNNKNICWKRFVYDEPSSIIVSNMRELHAGFIWFVSATPYDIYNKHKKRKGFMKIITFLLNKIIEYIIIKNDDNFVIESYQMPKTNYIHHTCNLPVYKLVNGLIDNKILKIIESGNIETAIELLGGKSTKSSIIDIIKQNKTIELEEIQTKIKIWELRNNEEKINIWKRKQQNVSNELIELEKRFQNMLNDTCSICYEIISQPVIEPNCYNIFCTKCLIEWLCNKNNCPLCRKEIKTTELIYKTEMKNDEDKKKCCRKLKTKEETIIEIINNNKNGKFILFSDYFESFYTIRKILNENNINFVELKGTFLNIQNNLENYKNGSVNVLFLNSKTDNSGLNLENTTDIILYHTLDENTTKQVIGRGNRLGRKIELNVHYLNV